MKALLWKDLRLNAVMILSCAVIAATVYVVAIILEIAATWPDAPTRNDWGEMLNSYGGVSIFFACCAAGLFSGNAIACERADRSAHFLAYLPPTKKQILASKLVVAGGATAAVWGWALLSIFVIAPAFRSTVDVDGPQLWDFAAMSGLIFGVGWVLSALLEKPLVPIIGALVSPGILALLMGAIATLAGWSHRREAVCADVTAACLGVAAFGGGTWGYWRRAEP